MNPASGTTPAHGHDAPSAIPTARALERELHRKMLWLLGPMFLLLGVFYFAYSLQSGLQRFPWTSTAIATSGAAGLAWGAWTGRHRRGLEIVNLGVFAAFAYSSAHQQGLYSSSLWWLCLPPVFLLLAGSLRLGVVTGIVLLAQIAALGLHGPQSMGSVSLTLKHPQLQMYLAETLSTVALLMVVGLSVYWRLQLQKALALATDAADEATRAKARFLAKMSHEIRTPLNGMVGATELIRRGRIGERQRLQLEAVQGQSAKMLLALVNDILDLSKIQERKLDLDFAPMRVRAVVFSINELYSVQAFNKGIDLTSSCAPEVPESLIGDELRLRQIVGNFVSNAVKFTQRGGVHIHVGLAGGDVRAPDGAERRMLRFEVIDSGPGIATEAMGRLFTPFQQAHRDVARLHGGTGLGLSICDELARLMGGRVEADSTPGQGSTFTAVIPMTVDLAAAPRRPRPRTGRRALVVASTPGLVAHLRGILDDLGIDAAACGEIPDARRVLDTGACAVFIDSALLAPHPEPARALGAIQSAGARAVVLAPLGADTMVGTSGETALLYKPVRRSCLRAAIEGLDADAGPEPARAAAPADEPHGAAAPRRVLVVDDNPVNQIVVQAMLADLGATARLASSGAEAVSCLADERFDLVLMDVEMPGMDGIAATRRIREREAAAGVPGVPVVAITGAERAERWEACREAGMDDFLTKPFQLKRLAQVLARARRRADLPR
ncbi:response regulator [Caldimonas sp. KR1-144]|uniref:response regulator n=1 Tax=Caldimonas sp. KR1-144 TaxID=3400911 RepID=UPI003C079E09